MLFSLYINDISSDIESERRLFADDCVCYREIKDEEDTIHVKLQRDIDRLGSWARKWGMRFQSVKCNLMQLTRKQIKKIHASYLENVESIKYLGVRITSDLGWNTHVSNVCTKANRTLGFLRRNLYSCPQEVKEAAYKGLVCPVLDYGSSVWDPPGVVLQEELESVQKRAARFVTVITIMKLGAGPDKCAARLPGTSPKSCRASSFFCGLSSRTSANTHFSSITACYLLSKR